MALCPCLTCDATGERFKRYYGYHPSSPPPPARRSHDEVVHAKRKRAEMLVKKREARARYYGNIKRRAAA